VDRLSPLDNQFLNWETETAHMHVGWVARLDAGVDVERLKATIASRLHLVPRFRQRLRKGPLGLGEPVWVDDPAFDLEEHVFVADGDVRELADRFLSVQLNRAKPLWEILVLPNAIAGKVHHAMVDGVAAVGLGMLLFDGARDAAPAGGPEWVPAPPPSARDLALEQMRTARGLTRLGLSPGRAVRMAESVRRAAFSLEMAPPTFLNGQLGPRRTLITKRLEMPRLNEVKQRHGVKLNDVVLAVVTSALRRYAAICDEQPQPLRAMVPVNTRGEDGGTGNRITFGFVDLPADEAPAYAQLHRIRTAMQELKDSGRIGGSEVLLRGLGLLPGPIQDRAGRLAASGRLFNLTVSNVPGPRSALFVAGAEVLEVYPVIPVNEGRLMSVGILTYRDGAHFAVYADPEGLEHLEEMPGLIEDGLVRLESVRQMPRRRAQAPRTPWRLTA
jgi:diacylglycerol O-acyltransferase / wax synthase